MCFGSSLRGNRSGRSQSPPPRPARRRPRHAHDTSDPASSSTRHRQKQRGLEVIRHHARRSSALVFEGAPSSAVPIPKRRSRKGSDETKTGKSRNRRRRRRITHIRRCAGDIPEDIKDVGVLEGVEEVVEDADPSVEIFMTRIQGKQPESKSEDEYNTKDEASKSPVHVQSVHSENFLTEINKKTAENVQIESSKAAVNNTAAQQPLIENQNFFKNIEAAGQTDAQKAASSDMPLANHSSSPPPSSSSSLSSSSSTTTTTTTKTTTSTGITRSNGGKIKNKNKKEKKDKTDDADDEK